MAKNWALVVGINGYNPLNFTPLKYAKRDAEQVKIFFEGMGFDEICFFTDDSPNLTLTSGYCVPTRPTYGNLVSFLEDRCQKPFLSTGDNCWFFFAGHGERHGDQDYLMPMDANSRGTKVIAGLQVDEVREWLTRSGADNVILLLDACRNVGSRGAQGIDPSEQKGVITISSCNPTERSWEIEELQHGVFTFALLEALGLPGERSCATVERLGAYLRHRVPDLCQRYGKVPTQLPRIHVDPLERQHFILMPQYARQADIDLMKKEGFRLAFEGQLQLAEQMFIRANVAARGLDSEIIQALKKIFQQDGTRVVQPEIIQPPNQPSSNRSRTTTPQRSTAPSPEPVEQPTPTPSATPQTAKPPQPQSPPTTTPVPRPAPTPPQTTSGTPAAQTITTPTPIPSKPTNSQGSRRKFLWLLGLGGVGTVTAMIIGYLPDNTSEPRDSQPQPTDSSSVPEWGTQTETSPQQTSNVDYSRLEEMLKVWDWKGADEETLNLMLQVSNRTEEGWLDSESLVNFPCEVLSRLDDLWVKYSDGKFGFSVQQQIWEEVGRPTAYNAQWEEFGDRVGWRKDGEWISNNSVVYDTYAPSGHLPLENLGWVLDGWEKEVCNLLLSLRYVNCSR